MKLKNLPKIERPKPRTPVVEPPAGGSLRGRKLIEG